MKYDNLIKWSHNLAMQIQLMNSELLNGNVNIQHKQIPSAAIKSNKAFNIFFLAQPCLFT